MDIEKLSYTDFISLIREENRPPGGKKTVKEYILNSQIDRKSKVLEVGCTNGFTSLEIARIVKCKTWGVDINERSLNNARQRVNHEKVKFKYGDAYNLPFRSNMFDLIICSNATSFMKDKKRAIREFSRITKPWGLIATSPMYYIKKPPQRIVNEVSKVIGAKIDVRSKKDWTDLFTSSGLEIYCAKDYKFIYKKPKEIEDYVKKSLDKPHLNSLPLPTLNAVKLRWKRTMKLFNENLKYVGYSIILLRKRIEPEEIELFDSIEA